MAWRDRPWRRLLAAVTGVGLIAASLLIMSHPEGFERLFLRTAGAVIEGVNDHLGAWIAGSVGVVVASWAAIGLACWWQRKPVSEESSANS